MPTNQEACTLVNPNVQIASEEIRTKLEQEKIRVAKIARMQLKLKLKQMGLLRQGDEGEEEATQQKTRKGKAKEKEILAGSGNKR